MKSKNFTPKVIIFVVAILLAGMVIGYGANSLRGRDDQPFFQRMMQRDSDDRYGQGLGLNNSNGGGSGMMGNRTINKGNCLAEECLAVDNLNYPAGTLSQEAKTALNEAIADEYKAHTFYDAVINKFGPTRPFSMIIRSEEQHISMLKALFDKYGIDVPKDMSSVTASQSITAACQAGVDAEKANASLYKDQLLPMVKDYEDITAVFNNLMSASTNNHLVAFERCN